MAVAAAGCPMSHQGGGLPIGGRGTRGRGGSVTCSRSVRVWGAVDAEDRRLETDRERRMRLFGFSSLHLGDVFPELSDV